jgi:hypothetical protein
LPAGDVSPGDELVTAVVGAAAVVGGSVVAGATVVVAGAIVDGTFVVVDPIVDVVIAVDDVELVGLLEDEQPFDAPIVPNTMSPSIAAITDLLIGTSPSTRLLTAQPGQ